MKLTNIALAVALVFTPTTSFAHGEPPQAAHGGQVQEVQENWVELVMSKDQVTLYILDQAGKPVSASEVSGTASVLVGAKVYKLELTPAAENRLDAQLPVAASGKVVATVSLKIGGKLASARFTIGK